MYVSLRINENKKNPNLNIRLTLGLQKEKKLEYRTFVAYEKINKVMQKSTQLITGL